MKTRVWVLSVAVSVACTNAPDAMMPTSSEDAGHQDGGAPLDACDCVDATTPDTAVPDVGPPSQDAATSPDQGTSAGLYQVMVNNGSGSGAYRAGDEVHVFASLVSTRSILHAATLGTVYFRLA